MNAVPLCQAIARAIAASRDAERSGHAEWQRRHADRAEALAAEHMPSGSGVDCGTRLVLGSSRPDRLTFALSFHHLDESGAYDGWTEHHAVVTPSLAWGFEVRITGRDRNDIKEYLGELVREALERTVDEFGPDR